jgi:hypothetical protein
MPIACSPTSGQVADSDLVKNQIYQSIIGKVKPGSAAHGSRLLGLQADWTVRAGDRGVRPIRFQTGGRKSAGPSVQIRCTD